MKNISNKTFDNERALYNQNNIFVSNCVFDGPSDGESALKECSDVIIDNCRFHLKYPLWHVKGIEMKYSEMYETCRAPLWYSENIHICNSKLHGVKALRECKNISLESCDIISPEFGWFCSGISIACCEARGEYMFLRSSNLNITNFEMSGKYSFQYIDNSTFENCAFDTKDAFWHAKNIYVKNCTIKGEYLAWYCENVTFENCTIIGTQPLCYCKNLKLINCEMHGADFAFEKSEVEAIITTPVISIKNPISGNITVPSADDIIIDEDWAKGTIIISNQ